MTTQEAAEILSVDRRSVRALIEAGKIKAKLVMKGKKRVYEIDETSFNEYIESKGLKKSEYLEEKKHEEIKKKKREPAPLDYLEALVIEGITRIIKG